MRKIIQLITNPHGMPAWALCDDGVVLQYCIHVSPARWETLNIPVPQPATPEPTATPTVTEEMVERAIFAFKGKRNPHNAMRAAIEAALKSAVEDAIPPQL